MQTSARRAIPYPNLTREDRPDVPAHLWNLVQKLDVDVIYQQGTDVARGASGYQSGGGRLWWTTDTHILWYDDGNNWWAISPSLAGALLLTIIDAKGDLIAGTGPDAATRLPAGTIGQILISDPGTATGLNWTDRNWIQVTQAASYTSADAAASTFVMTIAGVDLTGSIGIGSRVRPLQTTTKYFIVTGCVFSGGSTVVTMFGGTDYVLANAAITNLYFSNQQSPPGFPRDAVKWTVLSEYITNVVSNNPAAGVWVNPGCSIDVPIGSWYVSYQANMKALFSNPAGELTISATLSTTTNSETEKKLTASFFTANIGSDPGHFGLNVMRERPITVAAKTTHRLLAKSNDINCSAIGFYGSTLGGTVLEARCAYL